MHESVVLFAQSGGSAEPFAGLLSLVAVFWVIGIALTVFWLWMLIDEIGRADV